MDGVPLSTNFNSHSSTIFHKHSIKTTKMKKQSYIPGFVLTGLLLLAFSIVAAQGKKTKEAAPSELPYQAAIDHAYAKYKDTHEGKNADYIKELANVDP